MGIPVEWLIVLVSFLGLGFGGLLYRQVIREPVGTKKMADICEAIRSGAMSYMNTQYKVISVIAFFLTLVFLYIDYGLYGHPIPYTAIGFVVGAVGSAVTGYIGMITATKSNTRTAHAAKSGLGKALEVSFKGGAVMGLSVASLGLLTLTGLYMWFGDPSLLIGFAFGASLIALFARVGGGIFTKAADLGADLVGKVEAGIPEDDPRNPAVIADNVGDNVGDTAGMGADIYESYIVTILAGMLLGFNLPDSNLRVLFPLMLATVGILATIVGIFFVKSKSNPQTALNKGMFVTIVLSAVAFAALSQIMFNSYAMFGAAMIGLITTAVIGLNTEWFTSHKYRFTRRIARAAKTGPATAIIQGYASGLKSTMIPALMIAAAVYISYDLGGLYGIAIAGVGMLSTSGIIVSVDSFGPIADNAGGIAEMAKMESSVRDVTDELDTVGNTTAAVSKGFAIGSAAFAAIAIFGAYTQSVGIEVIDLMSPNVFVGLLIGAALPFLFTAFGMEGVSKAAFEMITEVRRQFRTDKGILAGTSKPDYAKCVAISTKAAQREMIAPGVLAVAAPLLVGFLLGSVALGGLIIGSIITGLLLAIKMANSGGALDNAKKLIEMGEYGGKGSRAHKAAVIGDTVGDPLKDTAGPSINPLIKVINTVSLLFASFFTTYGLLAL